MSDPPRKASAPAQGNAKPRRAEGVELIGLYEDSGFKEPPYLVRRSDGQTIQLSQLLFLVAESSDGQTTIEKIAERVSERLGRRISADNVRFLVEKKLQTTGVLAGPQGTSQRLKRADPMLALTYRTGLVPEGAVGAVTSVLRPFFLPPVVIAALLAMAAVDVWVFFIHGVAHGAHDVLYQPVFFLLVLGLVIASAGFHECGHATACRYGGAKPGVLGAGIYLVWPAFYSDVTDAYRLNRVGRLRTDLGGVYFNVIFMIAASAAYFFTRFEPLLVFILVQHFEMLHQFLPFLRLDGYYVVADLTGVPDMFQRIRPTLLSFLPRRDPDKRVSELKPWVRIAVTIWVILTAAFVLYAYGLLVISSPRIFATAWDSLGKQFVVTSNALGKGDWARLALGLIQVVILGLTLLGVVVTLLRTARRLLTFAWTKSEGKPVLRAAFVVVAVAAAGVFAYALLPRPGSYTPIQPNESGTLQASLVSIQQSAAVLTNATKNPSSVTNQSSASPSPSPTPSELPSGSPSPSPVESPSPSP